MDRFATVKNILRETEHGYFINENGGYAWAPTNVALCKYWGKRHIELNLPVTSSLSVSLGKKGAFTHIKEIQDKKSGDQYWLNGNLVDPTSNFAQRLHNYLNLFRHKSTTKYWVETEVNVPIATGLASSACGFAALAAALNNLYDWHLSKKDLSILARLGSGSACRSIWEGFVEWQAGEDPSGIDSYGIKLDETWPKLRVGALVISSAPKIISSTIAMQLTLETSPLYKSWPAQAAHDLRIIKESISNHDFATLGSCAEQNAIAMHKMMLSANPSIVYATQDTLQAINKVWELRKAGIPVYFTQDAGANIQLLFLAQHEQTIVDVFPEVEVIHPFAEAGTENVTLVDTKDMVIGSEEKLAAHRQGKLHRAFSIFILRNHNGKIEVLLQQRSNKKYHSGGLWSNTCCGHPRPSETIVVAASRRLEEEMGFAAELNEIGSFTYVAEFPEVGLIENEYDHVLIGTTKVINPKVNPEEVQNYRWIELRELQNDLAKNPQKYTVWLPRAMDVAVKAY